MSCRDLFIVRLSTVACPCWCRCTILLRDCAACQDSNARRHLVSNAQQLVRLTKGRNIVLSSGAKRAMELRGPHDVANLCGYISTSSCQLVEP